MKIRPNFTQIGEIDDGELVIKYTGTDLKMPYQQGKAFLSDSGIGYVSLPIRDVYCEENGEPEGLIGDLGRQIAEQLNDPSIKLQLRKLLASRDHSLFYSQAQEGIEIFCLLGMSGKDGIDAQNMPGMVIASYSTNGTIPSVEQVYAHHLKAVGKRKLITDRSTLEKEVLQLVPKANDVYERALQIMKDSGF